MGFPTFDASNKNSNYALSNGDLTATNSFYSTLPISVASNATLQSSGKWYFEVTVTDAGTFGDRIGIATGSFDAVSNGSDLAAGTQSYAFVQDGQLYRNNVAVHNFGVTYTTGDVISVLVDLSASSITIWKNGTPAGSTYSSLAAGSYRPAVGQYGATAVMTANFGAVAFAYTPTSGYNAWSAPSNDAAVTFSALTAESSGAGACAGAFMSMFAFVAGSDGAAGTLEALTGTGTGEQAAICAASFEPLTAQVLSPATAEGTLAALAAEAEAFGGGAASVEAAFERLDVAATGPGTEVGVGAPSFEPLQARALGEFVSAPVLEPLAADATALNGGVAQVAALLAPMAVSVDAVAEGSGSGAALFGALSAQAQAVAGGVGTGAAQLRTLQGRGTILVGGAGVAALELEGLQLVAEGHSPTVASAALAFPPLFAEVVAEQAVAQAFKAWAVNARNNGVTEYTAFPYNSLARYNGVYLAAGAGGIFRLDGEDDAGASIAWDFRTGLHDDKRPELKRLTEVVMGLRATGPVRVKVWKGEEESYEYVCPIFKDDMVHQTRVSTGRGLRSRYYQVGVSGLGVAAEFDSLQMSMPSTTRRLG